MLMASNSSWFYKLTNIYSLQYLHGHYHLVFYIIFTNEKYHQNWLCLDFFMPASAGGLSLESKWQQVSCTLLSFLLDLNNVVIWMISILPLISK